MTTIHIINLLMPYKLGSVNCYLIESKSNFFLIDTGSSNQRVKIEQELDKAGCKPGNLKLIIITHGDFDHIGNTAYLRGKFGALTAMHKDDSGMAENGDMFYNRKQSHFLVRKLISLLSGFGKHMRFTPDLYIEDGYNFSDLGFDAKILSIPGHSKGSVGVLTTNGDFFCGDLFENQDQPSLNSIIDDLAAAKDSLEKLKKKNITTVYPGHGKPFTMRQFIQSSILFIHQ